MPLPSRSRGLSVSRRDADIPPRKEHAMKEPPPRKRGRKSRRAAAAADLVPDEPFEDVRARARRARDFERNVSHAVSRYRSSRESASSM